MSNMIRPMGRRRQSNLDLPPRMYKKGKALYYVTSTTPRKWIPLGSDLEKARILWAEYEILSRRNKRKIDGVRIARQLKALTLLQKSIKRPPVEEHQLALCQCFVEGYFHHRHASQ